MALGIRSLVDSLLSVPLLTSLAVTSVLRLLGLVTYSPKRLSVSALSTVPNSGDVAEVPVPLSMRPTTVRVVLEMKPPRRLKLGQLAHRLEVKNGIAAASLSIWLLESPILFAVFSNVRRNMGLSDNIFVMPLLLPFPRHSYTHPPTRVICRNLGLTAAAVGHRLKALLNIRCLPSIALLTGLLGTL